MNFIELLEKRIIIGDGAMGTMLQAAGAAAGELPESLNIHKPELVQDIHYRYYISGSDFVSTNTFGANRLKLAPKGYSVSRIVAAGAANARKAAALAAEAAEDSARSTFFVAHSIGPIGKLLTPMGELGSEEAYDIFKEQICVGVDSGVDFILFETFTDIFEMKIAVLAAMENSRLPVVCSVTLQENGRMLSGTDPVTAVHVLQDMGITAIGLNCSSGPERMFGSAEDMLTHAFVPVLVQPNAGIPDEEGGKAVYNVSAESFCGSMESLIESGAAIVGGCCGTTPDHIAALYRLLCRKGFKRRRNRRHEENIAGGLPSATVCSASKTVFLGDKVRVIGERINPTGKQALKQALIDRDFAYVEDEAIAQIQAGAELLEVNMGLPDIDEEEMLTDCVKRLECITAAPLVIDCSHGYMIETALRVSRGKPMINSVSGEAQKMREIFPIVKKYGAAVIALTLDENGIPDSVEGRLAILDKIIMVAAGYGIHKRRIIVDCLTLTVSAQQDACVKTLEALRLVKEKYGMLTTLGVSNISYGLPERGVLNRTFLSMALLAGLDAPIIDPTNPAYMETVCGAEVLLGKDVDAEHYIEYMTHNEPGSQPVSRTAIGHSDGIPAIEPGIQQVSQTAIEHSDGIPALEPGRQPVNQTAIGHSSEIPALEPGIQPVKQTAIGHSDGIPALEPGSQPVSRTAIGHSDGIPAIEPGSQPVKQTAIGHSDGILAIGPGIQSANQTTIGYNDGIQAAETGILSASQPTGELNDGTGINIPDIRRADRMTSVHSEMSLEEIIIHGFDGRAAAAAEKLLLTASATDIIEQIVMQALEYVGKDYEKGNTFLPQMIKSAEAAKNALAVLRNDLKTRGKSLSYGRVILATVKDDIHDIGKNIVKSIMENYGYDIIDLGKDVPPEKIVKSAKEEKIKLIGLSALMTTTVANMSKTIAMLKAEDLDCVVMVGGAVLNANYAKKIGADFYGANAMDAVSAAKEIFQK